MGIGIIALGLWLLLGISFSINSIELFPDALSSLMFFGTEDLVSENESDDKINIINSIFGE